MDAGFLVEDRLLARAARRIADEDRARLGRRLDPGRRVDEVAGHHPLALGSDRDGSLAGQDAGPQSQIGCAEFLAQRRDRGHKIERGPHGPLRVVLGCGRRAPDRHHRVADELLHGAAVELDQTPARVEVAREELAHILGVAALGEGREAEQVGEQDRNQAALRSRCRRLGSDPSCRWRGECRSAFAAELLTGLVRSPTGRASTCQNSAALGAELPTLAILGAAARAERHIRAEPTATTLPSTRISLLRVRPCPTSQSPSRRRLRTRGSSAGTPSIVSKSDNTSRRCGEFVVTRGAQYGLMPLNAKSTTA